MTPDLNGVLSYFSAPNIRKKLVHPVFLALRFHQCVSLHYDKNAIRDLDQKHITLKLQDLLEQASSCEMTHQMKDKAGSLKKRPFKAGSPSFICLIDADSDLAVADKERRAKV